MSAPLWHWCTRSLEADQLGTHLLVPPERPGEPWHLVCTDLGGPCHRVLGHSGGGCGLQHLWAQQPPARVPLEGPPELQVLDWHLQLDEQGDWAICLVLPPQSRGLLGDLQRQRRRAAQHLARRAR